MQSWENKDVIYDDSSVVVAFFSMCINQWNAQTDLHESLGGWTAVSDEAVA